MYRRGTYPIQQPEQNLLIKLGLLSLVCMTILPSNSAIVWWMPILLWAVGLHSEPDYWGPCPCGAYIMVVAQDSGTQGGAVG